MNGQWEGKVEDLTVHPGEGAREEPLPESKPETIPAPEYPDGDKIAKFLRGMLPE